MSNPAARPYNPTHGNIAALAESTGVLAGAKDDLAGSIRSIGPEISAALARQGTVTSDALGEFRDVLKIALTEIATNIKGIPGGHHGGDGSLTRRVVEFLIRGVRDNLTIKNSYPLGRLLVGAGYGTLADIAKEKGNAMEAAETIMKGIGQPGELLITVPELTQIVHAARLLSNHTTALSV